MQRQLLSVVILFGAVIASAPAWAGDTSPSPAQATSKVILVQGGGFSAFGPGSAAAVGAPGAGYSFGLASGAYLFGMPQNYRLDASVGPNLLGGYTAGISAALGAHPGEMGASYGMKLGAGWVDDAFTVNPVNRLGLADNHEASDTAVSFSVTESITPRLSVVGLAEAHRAIQSNTTLDPTASVNQLVVGAGVGLRF